MKKFVLIKLLCLSAINLVTCQVSTNFTDGTNVPNVCLCATSGQCALAGGGGENDGSGVINPRILNTGGVNVGTNVSMCQPVKTGVKLTASDQSSCGDGLEMCCPDVGYTCGVSYPPISGAPQAADGQAPYNAYPHAVAIYSADNKYLGGGALIDEWNVLTAAHIIVNASRPLTIKIGYWDLSSSQEPLDRITLTSSSVLVHPNFMPKNLKNNIAIIKLPSAVPLGKSPTIGSICLPSAPISGIRCMLSGWGSQSPSTSSNILRHVDLPILSSSSCQSMLRTTKLNKTFVLDSESFICAGGEKGKDACSGDGGSPLSCYIVDRHYLVGVVSWGIGCGQPGVPGVYTNIFSYIPWIQKATAQLQSGNTATSSTPPSLPPKPTISASSTTTKGSPSSTSTVDGKVTKSDPTVTSTEKTVPASTPSKPTITSIASTLSTVLSTISSSLGTTVGSTASTTKASSSAVANTTTQATTTSSRPVTVSTTTSKPSTTSANVNTGSTTNATTTSSANSSTKPASLNTTTTTASSATRSGPSSPVRRSSTTTTNRAASTSSANAGSTTSQSNNPTTTKAAETTTTIPLNVTKPANGTTVKSGPTSTKPSEPSTTVRQQSSSQNPNGRSRTRTTTMVKRAGSTTTITVKGTQRRRSTSTTKNPNFNN
ncbi:hypothetical protein ACKWTF_014117 [Chironomus riparius]